MKMNAKVNNLPVLTMNSLKLNYAPLDIDVEFKENKTLLPVDLPGGISAETGLSVDELNKRFDELGIKNPGEKVVAGKYPMYNKQSFATGMGFDVDELMRVTGTAANVYTVESSYRSDEPILLHYDLSDGDNVLDNTFIHAKEGSESTFIMYYTSGNLTTDNIEQYDGAFDETTGEIEHAGKVVSDEGDNTMALSNDSLTTMNGKITKNLTTDKKGFSGNQTRVYLEKNAKVHLIKVQMLNKGFLFFDDIGGYSEADSSLEVTKLELGAGNVYDGLNEAQMGYRSDFRVDYGYIGLPDTVCDINYNDVFWGKKSNGVMRFSEALIGNAKKTFRGTVDFREGCKAASGDEQEDVLLFGEDIVNKTIPLILGEEEDVEGRHAATIGKLSDEMLFYMQTRGIEKKKAEELMVEASITSISARIPNAEIRDGIKQYVRRVFVE